MDRLVKLINGLNTACLIETPPIIVMEVFSHFNL